MSVQILVGDCLEVMPTLEADSVDAVVTDPPYGLSFMGKHWDHGVPGVDFWSAALRVAKPGSYLLAFGGTRTFHRLTCAIEDAGFEIQDCLSWLYGSGFPKHKSKLKPAWEPIIMARKPFKGTVAANVLEHGTGAINIDACRIASSAEDRAAQTTRSGASTKGMLGNVGSFNGEWVAPEGRWPANVILDEEAAGLVDEQSGARGGMAPASGPTHEGYNKSGSMAGHRNGMGNRPAQFHGDSGGASRFFYCAKASRSERNAGLEGFAGEPAGRTIKPSHGDRRVPKANHHPTVKPLALMQWLVRLVTSEGGLVLDPFMGSGTTGIAAVAESRRFIGIEREQDFAEIARARISATPATLFTDVA